MRIVVGDVGTYLDVKGMMEQFMTTITEYGDGIGWHSIDADPLDGLDQLRFEEMMKRRKNKN